MAKKNVVTVDFKNGKKKQNQEKQGGKKCCQHLDKCAGHSLNG